MEPFGPGRPGGYQPMPPGTGGSTYEFTTINYDGLLATDSDADVTDKSDADIHWEAEAESDGTFRNTITVTYAGEDATVEMSKNAEKVYSYTKEGARVVRICHRLSTEILSDRIVRFYPSLVPVPMLKLETEDE